MSTQTQQAITVGRIVRYFHTKNTREEASKEPYAAIITKTYGNDMVDLLVCPPGVMPYPSTSVNRGNEDGQWEFPERK